MDGEEILLETGMGRIRGRREDGTQVFLGIPYAKARRFAYAKPVDTFAGEADAGRFGPACPQSRQSFPHPEHPERRFYYREFREGQTFSYDEDACLNLNIYAPEGVENAPVILFFHGGGFNSGSNSEEPFRGYALAAHGIVTVFANYRVGVLGYLTHREIREETGRDGNFGLDDQLTAVRWVRRHIADFGGDPERITLMGQSAGAISIQYLCLNHENRGLFARAAMLSGGGLFPRFALPRASDDTHAYWEGFMKEAGCGDLEALRALDTETLFTALERYKASRKDNVYHTMPVVDGLLIPAPVDRLIRDPLPLDYLISFTSGDMYAPLMAHIGTRFGRANGAFLCYFDREAPGDGNGAFHSSELRYVFGRLETSWRPYGERDRQISGELMSALAHFAAAGNPNGEGVPAWQRAGAGSGKALCFGEAETKMGRPGYGKMLRYMLTKGGPKA